MPTDPKPKFENWTAKLKSIPLPPKPEKGESTPELTPEQELEKSDARERVPPKKARMKLVEFSATAQGTVEATGERERREWYTWTREGATYVAIARYRSGILGKRSTLAKGRKLIQAVKSF